MKQQVGGVLVDAISSHLLQFCFPITSGEHTNSEAPGSPRSEQIPYTVPYDHGSADRDIKTLRRGEKQVGVRLGALHFLTSDDRDRWSNA
jgi:hypothetical protein